MNNPNTFLLNLERGQNLTRTENGAIAYKSTLNNLVDYFSSAGAIRHKSEQEALNLFTSAFRQDPLAATRLLFYFRDVRGGQGERKHFRTVIRFLANKYPELVRQVIHLIPEYGRYDDLFELLDTAVNRDVVAFICRQLIKDSASAKPTLLAKWMPSVNTSSRATRDRAYRFIRELDTSPKAYRKMLSRIRAKLNVVERQMCARDWDHINYQRVPSRANLLYNGAFIRHDEARRRGYLSAVAKGEAKVNASVLYPHEIVGRCSNAWNADDRKHLDNMWNALPDFTGGSEEKAIVVCDTSASMTWYGGDPYKVAVGLSIYYAERNTGAFANKFITFSERPSLVTIKGIDIVEKVHNVMSATVNMNTNIEAVFKLILATALKSNPEDVPDRVYIISDMQFDAATGYGRCSGHQGLMQSIADDFERAGVKLPQLVFWNVRDAGTKPMTTDDNGWLMVSGYSPSIVKYLLESPTETYDAENLQLQLIADIVFGPRYSRILA